MRHFAQFLRLSQIVSQSSFRVVVNAQPISCDYRFPFNEKSAERNKADFVKGSLCGEADIKYMYR